jgi:transposase
LAKLAAKPTKDHCRLKTQAEAVLKLHRVGDYFATQINPESVTRHPRPGRPSKKDTSEQIIESRFRLHFGRQPNAIAQAEQLAGCRLYVTNLESAQLSLSQAMAYYREQWQLEHGFHRFKRGQLPALPIF